MPTHPRIDVTPDPPTRSAAELGYHMPAEWEPMDAVWVTPPHNRETWPGEGAFERAAEQHAAWVQVMRGHGVTVRTPGDLGAPTNDSWIRDYGPIFVVRDQGTEGPRDRATKGSRDQGAEQVTGPLAIHDFCFNAWGGKYEPFGDDDALPRRVAAADGLPVWGHDLVLEGGSIEVNGRGTVMTTTRCLFEAGRNPGWSRRRIETELHAALGTRHLIALPGGIAGDDTDGHIDDVARFIAPGVVAAVVPRKGHPDHAALRRNIEALGRARDQDGHALEVVELPAPEPIYHDFPPDRLGPGGRSPLPASYANFLILNGRVYLPVFGQPSDDRAARALEAAMAGHTIVPVRAEHLVVGLGACHCLSMQQPRAS